MKDTSKMPPAKIIRTRKRFVNGLTQGQRRDIRNDLEHLVATGLKYKRDHERRIEFHWNKEGSSHLQSRVANYDRNEHSDSEDGGGGAMSIDSKNQYFGSLKETHMEDVRLYGDVGIISEGFTKGPWPEKQRFSSEVGKKNVLLKNRSLNSSDKNWDIEYGDSVHPLAFASAKLVSSPYRSETIKGKKLDLSSTDISLSEEQIPRAMLLRCWERAVHAACMVFPLQLSPKSSSDNVTGLGTPEEFPVDTERRSTIVRDDRTGGTNLLESDLSDEGGASPIESKLKPVKEPGFVITQRRIAEDLAATRRKCKSLGVGLLKSQVPEELPENTCPTCERSFQDKATLSTHYFGGRNARGCCWGRIEHRHHEVVADVLEFHVKAQMDGFLGLVLHSASECLDSRGNKSSNNEQRIMGWHDILAFAEDAIKSARLQKKSTSTGTSHPLMERFQPKSNEIPIVLNPVILQNARNRLINRYANIPL